MALAPALKPFTINTLSAFARYYLKSTSPSLFEDDSTSNISPSETKPNIETLTEFTLFPKLPTEIQNEVWKHFSKFQPRMISINWENGLAHVCNDGNEIPALYHISRDTRRDTLKVYGYVALEHPETHKKTLFHPEIDLLYITASTDSVAAGPATLVVDSLQACGALTRIRGIAISVVILDVDEHLILFQKWPSLELVLPVGDHGQLIQQPTKAGRLRRFFLEENKPYLDLPTLAFVEQCQKSYQHWMARDGGVTPFIGEVDYIPLPDEQQPSKAEFDVVPVKQEISIKDWYTNTLYQPYDSELPAEQEKSMEDYYNELLDELFGNEFPDEQVFCKEEFNTELLDELFGNGLPNEQVICKEELYTDLLEELFGNESRDQHETPVEECDMKLPAEQEALEGEFDIEILHEEQAWMEFMKHLETADSGVL